MSNGQILWSDSLGIDTKSELIFFTQYEREIDKFKPSRSGFVLGLYRQSYENDNGIVEEWDTWQLKNILVYMKKHPIKSYIYTYMQKDKIWEEINGIKCLKIYICDFISYYKHALKDWLELQNHIVVSKKLLKKLTEYDGIIIDRGDCCSPRIEIVIRRKSFYNYNLCEKQEKLIEHFEDKWFNKISLNQYDLELQKVYTAEQLDADKELHNDFNCLIRRVLTDLTSDSNVISCNCRDI